MPNPLLLTVDAVAMIQSKSPNPVVDVTRAHLEEAKPAKSVSESMGA